MTAPWIDTNQTIQKGFIHDTVYAPLILQHLSLVAKAIPMITTGRARPSPCGSPATCPGVATWWHGRNNFEHFALGAYCGRCILIENTRTSYLCIQKYIYDIFWIHGIVSMYFPIFIYSSQFFSSIPSLSFFFKGSHSKVEVWGTCKARAESVNHKERQRDWIQELDIFYLSVLYASLYIYI